MIEQSAYGKSSVRLVTIDRHEDRHELLDLTVAVRFEGDFDASYADGDNARVLPTDTMKNTVYALAAEHGVRAAESFGVALSGHFLRTSEHVRRVTIDLAQQLWDRMDMEGRAHPHAFVRHGPETRTATVTADRTSTVVEAGVDALVVLKSAASAFEGFPRDRFTTLPETSDRILATSLTATWRYARGDVSFDATWRSVRQKLLATFADHDSRSVQHTLYAMGRAALDSHDDLASIRLVMPNKHHIPFDVSRFGMENRNTVFVATDEPFGLIEATIVRDLPRIHQHPFEPMIRALVVLLLAAGPVAALFAADDDPFAGRWQLAVDKSTFDPGPPLVSSLLTIAAIPAGRRVTTDSVAADGRTMRTSYAATFDGDEHPLEGSAAIDTVALRRLDSRTIERTDRKDGRVVTTYRLRVSDDGGTLTITMNGMSTMGQPVRNLLVYRRI